MGRAKRIRLPSWRDRACLTQLELAEKAGLSRSAIARIEAGLVQPQPRTRRALAKALGLVDPHFLEEAPPRNGRDEMRLAARQSGWAIGERLWRDAHRSKPLGLKKEPE